MINWILKDKNAMEESDFLTYSTAFKYFNKNNFDNPPKEPIKNKELFPNFSDGMFKNIADITINPGGLPITLRTSTLRSQAIVYSNKKNDGIHLKVIKRYKLYDEFKQPYNISGGLPSKKETGTPYSMSDGYKDKILIDRTFKNEREAKKFLENMGTMKVMTR